MLARRFGTSPLTSPLTRETSSWTLEEKFHISAQLRVLYISQERKGGGRVEGIEGTPHASFPFCIKDDAVKNYVKVVYPTGTSITTGKMRTQTEEPCIWLTRTLLMTEVKIDLPLLLFPSVKASPSANV